MKSLSLYERQASYLQFATSFRLFNFPLIFGPVFALANPVDPIGTLIAIFIAIAKSAANEWASRTPLQKLNIVKGNIQVSLTSTETILWDAVGAIANKLKVMVKRGFDGFFGAISWHETSTGQIVAIGIGVGLTTAAMVTAGYGILALQEMSKVVAQLLTEPGFAELEEGNLVAPIIPIAPAAQFLADAMLLCVFGSVIPLSSSRTC